ncbi:unnamed protein product [Kluyveromyces dobzhanskii CBS 2104]|uniref:WGS project CCBQ000000000 data, contig 00058 n=1 Tax=Kluyveromyces dobzhanskii CBS 2104 TaxID=1427455 RepID=A0A0A8LCC2_9SACH|nr:unnamed protein product [Kluyveromyces dobzhanskii CBS 2104]
MTEIPSKLVLVTKFVLRYLEEQTVSRRPFDLTWKDASNKSTAVDVAVDAAMANKAFKKELDKVEVVGLEMASSDKCMLSICSEDESLVQGIFPYSSLLDSAAPLSFPMKESDANELYTEKVFDAFTSKFKFPPLHGNHTLSKGDSLMPSADDSQTKNHDNIFKERVEQMVSNRPSNDPPIPGFEDEYEVQTGPGIPSSGEFGVPGLGVPLGGYGDNDLYPNGMRFPQDFDPLGRGHNNNQQGGMIYDPFRGPGPSPNPLSKNGNPDRNSSSQGPPFPGVKYDDPFGRLNHQGGGGGFI